MEEITKSLTNAIESNHKNLKTNKNTILYANPKSPTQTWNGHEKRPDWIKNLPEGKTKEDCIINKANIV